MGGTVHSESTPGFILKKPIEAYPNVTDSPVKVLMSSRIKNTR